MAKNITLTSLALALCLTFQAQAQELRIEPPKLYQATTPGYAVTGLVVAMDTQEKTIPVPTVDVAPPANTTSSSSIEVAPLITLVLGIVIGVAGLLFLHPELRPDILYFRRRLAASVPQAHSVVAATLKTPTPPSSKEPSMTTATGSSQSAEKPASARIPGEANTKLIPEPEAPSKVTTLRLCDKSSAELLDIAKQWAEAQLSSDEMLLALQEMGLKYQSPHRDTEGVVSQVGPVRTRNEDTGLIFRAGSVTVLMSFDGMGGYGDGNWASRFAALALSGELHHSEKITVEERLKQAFLRLNKRFNEAGLALYGKVEPNAFRTTAIVVVATPTHYHTLWQGDGGGWVKRSTGEAIELMTPHKGAAANMVTRSLGPVPDGEPDYRCIERMAGDILAIMSDGVADRTQHLQLLEALDYYAPKAGIQETVAYLVKNFEGERNSEGNFIADDNMTLLALATPAQPQILSQRTGTQ